jgi:hypothetical protein
MRASIRRRLVPGLTAVSLAAGSLMGIAVATPAAAATTYVVDTVADNAALSACTAAADDCSLRGAVAAANANAGADIIGFDIPAASCPGGVCRIVLTDGPITISDPVDLDGTAQPQNDAPQANVCATTTDPSYMRIEVVTNPTSGDATGVIVDHATGSSTIHGLAFGTDYLGGFKVGLLVTSGTGHQIYCNHFSLDAAGDSHLGTRDFTEQILLQHEASEVVVGTNGDGSDDVAERNVFGGAGAYAVYVNGDADNHDNWVAGNYFGFTADGTAKVGAGSVYMRQISVGNLVGTNEDGLSDDLERNFFGSSTGVQFNGSFYFPMDNEIVGNVFGVTPSGLPASVGTGIEVDGLAGGATGNEIRGNYIVSAGVGVSISGDDSGAGVLVSDNVFGTTPVGDGQPNATAIALVGSGSSVIQDNRISGATTAGLTLADSAGLGSGSTGNCLVDNAAGATNTTGTGVTFENNWWGSSTGPSGAGPGSGDSVSADIDYDPWLTSAPAGCATPVTVADAMFSMAEDVVPGAEVGTVVATGGGSLSYSITGGNTGGAFALGSSTGVITTAAALDYETTPAYSLTVEATNGTESDTATVDIDVSNVAPVVADASFSVTEDVAPGSTVGAVTAVDAGATLAYSITAGNTGGAFTIDGATGEITTATALDYIAMPSYSLTVAASDGFLAGTATVDIEVADVARFEDVPMTDTFYGDIEWLAWLGITKGCNPPAVTRFCPDDSVTRGQMAAFLHRALGGVLTPGDPVSFIDISGSVFETDIEWLGSVGVTKGCNPPANDQYCPNDAVTRGQMAAFLVRAFAYTAGGGSDRFTDDDGSVFEADIERLAEAGVTLGCNPPANDHFCPTDPVTRAQMAAFLHRAVGS